MSAFPPPNPIEALNTPCPACRQTVMSLTLKVTTAIQCHWRATCPSCGWTISLSAMAPAQAATEAA